MITGIEIHRICSVVPLSCSWWAIVRMNYQLTCRLTVCKNSGSLGDIVQCSKHQQDQDELENKRYKDQHISVIHLHCEKY